MAMSRSFNYHVIYNAYGIEVLDPTSIQGARTPLPDMMNNGYRSENMTENSRICERDVWANLLCQVHRHQINRQAILARECSRNCDSRPIAMLSFS